MAYFDCIVGGSGDGSTLTVTCYSGFAGLTISITNGVDTFSEVCPSTSPYEVVFDGLSNGTWTVSTVYGGQTYTKTVEINGSTIFYPIPNGATVTPINNIQTWLHCADIWDKNYTTIGQVLADASTLQALIASNNAADYMARSTSWASSVTANSNAMTYIGANNYCANKLLANSTWCNAICNSTYFESVLNVKVPTMTSNTAPYGTVSASLESGDTKAFGIFDGHWGLESGDLDYWQANASSAWFQYKFVNTVKVRKIVIGQKTASTRQLTIQLQGSNNGTNFTNIQGASTTLSQASPVQEISFMNNTSYLYYRVTCQSTDSYCVIAGAQFYGRA